MNLPSRLKLPALALLAGILLLLLNVLIPDSPGRASILLLITYPIVALLLGGALRLTGSSFGASLLTTTVVFLAVLYLQYGIDAYKYLPIYLLFAGIGTITAMILKRLFERNID